MLRQENRETKIYILVNYALSNTDLIPVLEGAYPALIFSRIAPQIFTVEVPPGGENEFVALNNSYNFITEPTIFGLNASQALDISNISVFHNYPFGEVRGKGTVIGFIDTGIEYTNVVFKNADDTTRLLSIWDQTETGTPPPGYNYGAVYTREQINEALKVKDPYAIVPSRDEIGHGTYLAGVAAGNDQTQTSGYVGAAPDAGIIMVKMRQTSQYLRERYLIPNNVPAYEENDLIAGINYLVTESVRLRTPLVICIGVGNNYGAHNGTSIVEGYLSALSQSQNIIIVTAAGNEANAGHHYQGRVTEAGSNQIEINVVDGEEGVLIYVMTTIPDKITIGVRSPLGQTIEKIPLLRDQEQVFRFNLEKTVLTVSYIYPDSQTGGQKIDIRLREPTPGIWTITVFGDKVTSGVYHMWLPRVNFIKTGTRFLSPNPDTTVQIPGTDEYSLTVGAYDYVDDSIYVGSGRGPTTSESIQPVIIAPGVNVPGPSLNGGTTTYVGTSTAAAITAGASALLLQWSVLDGNLTDMNTRIARTILMRGARRKSGIIYPNNIEGYGRLDLQNSIANI